MAPSFEPQIIKTKPPQEGASIDDVLAEVSDLRQEIQGLTDGMKEIREALIELRRQVEECCER
jgi:uncharacterized coiled-coil DUF342 family protein